VHTDVLNAGQPDAARENALLNGIEGNHGARTQLARIVVHHSEIGREAGDGAVEGQGHGLTVGKLLLVE